MKRVLYAISLIAIMLTFVYAVVGVAGGGMGSSVDPEALTVHYMGR